MHTRDGDEKNSLLGNPLCEHGASCYMQLPRVYYMSPL